MTARITNINLSHYGSTPSGTFHVTGEDFTSTVAMDEEDCRILIDQAFRFFEAKQAKIGQAIATVQLPNLLAPPEEAEYSEVPF